MGGSDDDLHRLLSEPVLPDEHPRRPWAWVLGALILIGVVSVTLLARGFGEPLSADPSRVASLATSSTNNGGSPPTSTLPPLRWPEGRIDGSMAWDRENDLLLLLGGRPGFREDPFTSAWVRDSAGMWSPVESTLEPSARELAPMTFDESSGRVLVFGGSPDPTFSCGRYTFVTTPIGDVWSFDGSALTWVRIAVSGGPTDRWGHSATYLPAIGRVLVFGGIGTEFDGNIAKLLGDTWLFDPEEAAWESIESADVPAARACHAVAYDPRTDLAYMWGGQTGRSTSDGSLWTLDPGTLDWSEAQMNEGPAGRWLHQMVYEPQSGLLYVIGGFGPQVEESESGSTTALGATDEVWALDTGTLSWRQMAASPVPMSGHAAAADGGGNIVVFHGRSTLVYDAIGDSWTDVTPYELLEGG